MFQLQDTSTGLASRALADVAEELGARAQWVAVQPYAAGALVSPAGVFARRETLPGSKEGGAWSEPPTLVCPLRILCLRSTRWSSRSLSLLAAQPPSTRVNEDSSIEFFYVFPTHAFSFSPHLSRVGWWWFGTAQQSVVASRTCIRAAARRARERKGTQAQRGRARRSPGMLALLSVLTSAPIGAVTPCQGMGRRRLETTRMQLDNTTCSILDGVSALECESYYVLHEDASVSLCQYDTYFLQPVCRTSEPELCSPPPPPPHPSPPPPSTPPPMNPPPSPPPPPTTSSTTTTFDTPQPPPDPPSPTPPPPHTPPPPVPSCPPHQPPAPPAPPSPPPSAPCVWTATMVNLRALPEPTWCIQLSDDPAACENAYVVDRGLVKRCVFDDVCKADTQVSCALHRHYLLHHPCRQGHLRRRRHFHRQSRQALHPRRHHRHRSNASALHERMQTWSGHGVVT